jgi:ABC-type dipeptide/oligopeptide/nickel transport system permease subunit
VSEAAPARASGVAAWWEAIRRDRRASLGFALLMAFVIVGVIGAWLVGDPDAMVSVPLQPPSSAHWLGTTGQGQDVFAQAVVTSGASSTASCRW